MGFLPYPTKQPRFGNDFLLMGPLQSRGCACDTAREKKTWRSGHDREMEVVACVGKPQSICTVPKEHDGW